MLIARGAHPLDGIWCKLKRADEHLENLDREYSELITDHYRIAKQPKGDVVDYIMVAAPPLPNQLRIGAIVGEIVQQLRSSLDHLLWELTPEDSRDERYTKFPICKTANDYRSSGQRRVGKAIPEARAMIEALQPYQRGDEYARHPLYVINELSRMDKHRVLLMIAQAWLVDWPDGQRGIFRFGDDGSRHSGGANVMRVPADRVRMAEMEPQFTFLVSLGDAGELRDRPIFELLEHLIEFTKGAIEQFARLPLKSWPRLARPE